jgi:hypothetical protein
MKTNIESHLLGNKENNMPCPKCNSQITFTDLPVYNYGFMVGRNYCPICGYSLWDYKPIGTPSYNIDISIRPQKQYYRGINCVVCGKFFEFGNSHNQVTCSEECSINRQKTREREKYFEKRYRDYENIM